MMNDGSVVRGVTLTFLSPVSVTAAVSVGMFGEMDDAFVLLRPGIPRYKDVSNKICVALLENCILQSFIALPMVSPQPMIWD